MAAPHQLRTGLMGASMETASAGLGIDMLQDGGTVRDMANTTLRLARTEQEDAKAREDAAKAADDRRTRSVVEVVRMERVLEQDHPSPFVPPWPKPKLSTRQRSDCNLRILELKRELKNKAIPPSAVGKSLLQVCVCVCCVCVSICVCPRTWTSWHPHERRS